MNILNHVLIEVAQKKRRCHHNGSHEILKGSACLVVVGDRGNKRNYCPECAKPMLEAAEQKLAAFTGGLGFDATGQQSSRTAVG